MKKKLRAFLSFFTQAFLKNKKALGILLLLSFILTLGLNIYVFEIKSEFGWGASLLSFLSSWLMGFAFVLLAYSCHKIVFFLYLWGSILFLYALTWFFKLSGLVLNDQVLASILETKSQEIGIYLNVFSVGGVLLVGVLCFFFVRFFFKKCPLMPKMRWPFICLALGIIVCLNVIWYRGLPYNLYMPHFIQTQSFSQASKFPLFEYKKIGNMLKEYYQISSAVNKSLAGLKDPALLASDCREKEPVTLVIHVGEALRADRLPMNGYERETTPLLSTISDIISFPKVISYATATRESTLGMLSDATVEERVLRHKGFMSLFNKHGFKTWAYIPPSGSLHDMPAYRLLADAQELEPLAESAQFNVMNSLPRIFEKIESGTQDKQVIYLNNIGNHPAYYSEKKHKKFLPDEINVSFPTLFPKENMGNAYDNATHQNDEFFAKLIEKLKDKNALYFYCSDHGQSLGENGFYTQNGPMEVPEQRYVACFVWASESFQKTHPEIWKNLKENAQRLKVLSHDHFYHTVLGLGSIESQVIDPKLNLCAPTAEEWKGQAPPFPAYDAQLEKLKQKKESVPSPAPTVNP